VVELVDTPDLKSCVH